MRSVEFLDIGIWDQNKCMRSLVQNGHVYIFIYLYLFYYYFRIPQRRRPVKGCEFQPVPEKV